MINKKLTEYEEINSFYEILENYNFFNNNIIENNIFKRIGLIYTMNCLFDAKTNDMLADDIWDNENFSDDAKFVIATYILDDARENILKILDYAKK
jgi:hypothetical protein